MAIIFRDGNYVRELSGYSQTLSKDAPVIVQGRQAFTTKNNQ
jgi:hypothetical protein